MAQGFGADIPPPVNSTAKRYLRGMKKGRVRWNKLYGNRAAEVMHKTANKMATQEQVKMPPTYKEIFGENKSGDDSLHDWFTKSRASDGTPGWVQLGGKYAGKPCAKQPGQTTKPKCGSSKMKRALNSDEEEAAFQRKNRQDPNPDARGKVKNVRTEAADTWHPDPEEDRKLSSRGAKLRAREDRESADAPKEDPRKLKPGESYMDYAKRHGHKPAPKEGIRDKIKRKLGLKREEKDHEVSMAQSQLDSAAKNIKTLKKSLGKKEKNIPAWMQAKISDTAHNMDAAATYKEEAGEKDACYHKVKSRYKKWPSAYASGALVKCRKAGADNWGNKSEGVSFQEFQEKALKCWKGCRRVPGTVAGTKGSCTCEETTNESAAWTRKEGQNSKGGLNEKGRKSYERENPGSDLKAPSKKVGNPRRASFCARMRGMRKRQKPSNNTGDDRLSKSLRAWNC
jgi:hypothetical protein